MYRELWTDRDRYTEEGDGRRVSTIGNSTVFDSAQVISMNYENMSAQLAPRFDTLLTCCEMRSQKCGNFSSVCTYIRPRALRLNLWTVLYRITTKVRADQQRPKPIRRNWPSAGYCNATRFDFIILLYFILFWLKHHALSHTELVNFFSL